MEHISDIVTEGKHIGENSYHHRVKKYTELALVGIKVDFYDPREKVIYEV